MIRRSLYAAGFGHALVAGLTIVSAAALQPAAGHRFERPVRTTGAGPQKLRIDVTLLTAAQPFRAITIDAGAQATGGLSDLRLYDASGGELPYLLVAPPARRPLWIEGAVLPVAQTKTRSGFEVDLGGARLVDALELAGLPAPFLKRFVLEGSGDRARWTVLVSQGTLFDLPEDRVRRLSADFPAGMYRYLRVTWDDTNSAVVPLPARASAREAAIQSAASPLRARIEIERQPSEPRRSRHRLRLPAAGLPITAVILEVGPGDVFRTATVMESRFSGARADPVELGRARLIRRDAGGGAGAAALRVPVDAPRGSELQLVIEDGNNPPLDVQSVFIEFAELPWIYFEAPAGSVVARYGDPRATPPQYDLEARRGAVRLESIPEAEWGDPRPAAAVPSVSTAPPVPDRGARLDTSTFRYRRSLPESAAGLVSLQLDAAVLAHSRGNDGRFGDVRVVDSEGYQIPYLLERRDEPLAIDLEVRPAGDREILRTTGTARRSAYVVTLPHPNLPSPRLVIETSDRVFRRPLQIGVERRPDRQHRDVWLDVLGSRIWQHADQGTPAEPLEIAIRPGETTDVLLIVEEGDNRPLPITAARLLLPSWRVRFFKPSAPVSLLYGSDTTTAPQYDLALLAPAVMGADARELSAAPEQASESARQRQLPPVIFWAGLGVAAVVLLGLLVRLISSGTAPPPSPPAP